MLGIEYWASQGGMQQAHALLERMRLTKVPSEPYVEAATVEAIYKVRCVWHGSSIELHDAAVSYGRRQVPLLCSAAGVKPGMACLQLQSCLHVAVLECRSETCQAGTWA